jgi:hypothetical protein
MNAKDSEMQGNIMVFSGWSKKNLPDGYPPGFITDYQLNTKING